MNEFNAGEMKIPVHKGFNRLCRQGLISQAELSIVSDVCSALADLQMGGVASLSPSVVRFLHWVDALSAARVPVGPVLELLEGPLGFSAIDQKYRRRKGWARRAFFKSLQFHPIFFRRGVVLHQRRQCSSAQKPLQNRKTIYASRAACLTPGYNVKT